MFLDDKNTETPDYIKVYEIDDKEIKHIKESVQKALSSLTSSSAYFTHRRLMNAINRTFKNGTDMPDPLTDDEKKDRSKIIQYNEKVKKVRKRKDFINKILEKGDIEKAFEYILFTETDLLILSETPKVYTTRDMIKTEQEFIELAKEKTNEHLLNEQLVMKCIEEKVGISDEQKQAVIDATLTNFRVTPIEGTAGAGKSFTMDAVKNAYMKSGYKIMGAALSWNASAVLSASAGIDDCIAIEGLVRKMEGNQKESVNFFRQKTLLIVDEAGLVGTKHMSALLKYTKKSDYPVKVILTGDSEQLNPVAAGNALETIVYFHTTTRIDTIRRQKQETHREAVKNFAKRQSGIGLNTYLQQEAITWGVDKQDIFHKIIRDYVSYRMAHPNKTALVLALTNNDVTLLNKMIRIVYKKMGLVYGMETTNIEVTDGRTKWVSNFAIGDEVVVRKNEKDVVVYEIPSPEDENDISKWKIKRRGVFNRNNGKVVKIEKSELIPGSYNIYVDMIGDQTGRMCLNTSTMKHDLNNAFPVVHNFATTIYASQGQTVNKIFLLDSPSMQFRLAYVGASRHTESMNIYINEMEVHTRLDKKNKAEPNEIKEKRNFTNYTKVNEEYPVKLKRYTRAEMLGSVAAVWGKDEKNRTAALYRELELGKPSKKDDPELFKIKQDPKSKVPNVIDFDMNNRYIAKEGQTFEDIAFEKGIISSNDLSILPIEEQNKFTKWLNDVKKFSNFEPEWELEAGDLLFLSERFNVYYPTVDLEKMFNRDDLYKEATITKKIDIDLNNQNASNVIEIVKEELAIKQEEDNTSLFNKKPSKSIFSKLFGKKEKPVEKEKTEIKYQDLANYDPLKNDAIKLTQEEIKRQEELAKKNQKPEIFIPFLPAPNPEAIIDRKGRLYFKNQEEQIDPKFLDSTKGILWGEGLYYQPRIFANDGENILSRYDLDGNCVVGEGFPPVLLNPHVGDKAAFCIVPNVKNYFNSFLFFLNKYRKEENNGQSMPNIIWGAKDVDWSKFFTRKTDYYKRTVILKGKTDEYNEWAINIQNELYSKLNIQIGIKPEIEGHIPIWKRPEEKNDIEDPIEKQKPKMKM